MLEWLTPDPKGKFVRTPFEVTAEDRAQVLAELEQAQAGLKNLDFPMVENPQNDPEIDYWQNFGR